MAVCILTVGTVNARLAGREGVTGMYMNVRPCCVKEPRRAGHAQVPCAVCAQVCTCLLHCLCIPKASRHGVVLGQQMWLGSRVGTGMRSVKIPPSSHRVYQCSWTRAGEREGPWQAYFLASLDIFSGTWGLSHDP